MEQKKLSPNRQKKEKIVARLTEKAGKAKGLVFTNYQGLTHKQLENLKKKVKTANAELIVTKNTLLLHALEIGNWKLKIGNSFQDPTATLFLYGDPVGPLKEVVKVIKEFSLLASPSQRGPTIKFGILDGEALTGDQLLKISSLPSREVLLIQLLRQMQLPIYKLHRALGWNLQKFVMTLKAIESQNSKSQAPNSK